MEHLTMSLWVQRLKSTMWSAKALVIIPFAINCFIQIQCSNEFAIEQNDNNNELNPKYIEGNVRRLVFSKHELCRKNQTRVV